MVGASRGGILAPTSSSSFPPSCDHIPVNLLCSPRHLLVQEIPTPMPSQLDHIHVCTAVAMVSPPADNTRPFDCHLTEHLHAISFLHFCATVLLTFLSKECVWECGTNALSPRFHSVHPSVITMTLMNMWPFPASLCIRLMKKNASLNCSFSSRNQRQPTTE